MPYLSSFRIPGAERAVANGAVRLIFMHLALVLFVTSPVYAQRWQHISPSGASPPGRAHATAIYDSLEHRIVMFGGRGEDGFLNDVWILSLDHLEWTEITLRDAPQPLPRSTPAGAYDADGGRMIIWSGQGNMFFDDVWALDLLIGSWTELTPTTEAVPASRYGVAAVFDPASRDLVTFAGFTNQGRFDDTWRFDIDHSAWSEINTGSDNPDRRCLHTAVYDAARHRMIMYGGQRAGPLGDIWAFDLGTDSWSEFIPSGNRPAGRYFATSIYDDSEDRMLLFGGNRGSQVLTNELWSFTFSENSWKLLSPTGDGPSPREGAVGVYVPGENRMIVVGGRSSSYLNDVWSLDLRPTDTAAAPEETTSPGIQMHQNYPNPIAGATTIVYDLPRPMAAEVAIYDVLGRRVSILATGVHAAGRHKRVWDVGSLAPGTYVCRLSGGGVVHRQLLVVVVQP